MGCVEDVLVMEPIKADARRFARIVRANADSVSPEAASKLVKFAETIEAELKEIEAD